MGRFRSFCFHFAVSGIRLQGSGSLPEDIPETHGSLSPKVEDDITIITNAIPYTSQGSYFSKAQSLPELKPFGCRSRL